MEQLRLRNSTPTFEQLEEGGVSRAPREKKGSFCGRTCIVLAAAGVIGSLFYLVNCCDSSDEHLNTQTCFNATQYTQKTGLPAPNEHDLYCTYADQDLPRQMSELVSAGLVKVIEQAGSFIYQGARLTFECINNGMLWRQYRDESHCVRMDKVNCTSLGGTAFHGGSVCRPTFSSALSASQAGCSRDLVDLCKWPN